MIGAALDNRVLADRLDAAARTRAPVPPLTDSYALDLTRAYAVQAQLVARRLERGERIVGLKMGFTSQAMRRQMAVDRPNCGWLTDAMAAPAGSTIELTAFIHPRVEPEVALLLGRDLVWPAGKDDVEAAVDACAPALEVVDSRFHAYRFRLEDNTADNSSAAAFVVGEWRPWPVGLGRLSVRLLMNGAAVEEGATDAVLGHPLNSLREAARLATELGRPLRKGMIVLTGGVTSAHPLEDAEQVRAEMDALGSVVAYVNKAGR